MPKTPTAYLFHIHPQLISGFFCRLCIQSCGIFRRCPQSTCVIRSFLKITFHSHSTYLCQYNQPILSWISQKHHQQTKYVYSRKHIYWRCVFLRRKTPKNSYIDNKKIFVHKHRHKMWTLDKWVIFVGRRKWVVVESLECSHSSVSVWFENNNMRKPSSWLEASGFLLGTLWLTCVSLENVVWVKRMYGANMSHFKSHLRLPQIKTYESLV